MTQINERESIPWERRRYLGLAKALWQTANEVIFHPGKFFKKLVGIDSCSDAFTFFLTINILGGFTGSCILILSNIYSLKLIIPYLPFLILAVILAFVFICIAIFISSAFMHLFVFLFKGEGGFSGTFNVIAYSDVVGVLWSLLLFAASAIIKVLMSVFGKFTGIAASVGLIFSFSLTVILIVVGILWMVIIAIIGYKRIHSLNAIKASFAFLIPIILLTTLHVTVDKSYDGSSSLESLVQARIREYELAAKTNLIIINTACQNYFALHGRYPSSVKDLASAGSLYINKELAQATNPSSAVRGYFYIYELVDKKHFKLYAKPADPRESGQRVFYTDQSGILRSDGPEGAPVAELADTGISP